MVNKYALSAYFIFNVFSVNSLFSSVKIVQLPSSNVLESRLNKAGYQDFAQKTGLVEKLTRPGLTLDAIAAQARFAAEVYPLQPSPTRKDVNVSKMLEIILQDNPEALRELAQ